MRVSAGLAIIVASLASVATSSPSEPGGPDAAPGRSRFWSAYSEPSEDVVNLEASSSASFRVVARLEGDLQVLGDEHQASLAINARAIAQDDRVPTLTVELSDDTGVIAAETLRAQDTSIRLPASFPTEACPREPDQSCEYALDLVLGVGEVPAEVEWFGTVTASGQLEEPAIVDMTASLESESL